MTWPTIARKEFADAVRARILWGIVAVIAVMTSLSAGIGVLVPSADTDPTTAIGGAAQFAGLLVPILALIAAYLAIAGERESGSLKILLGLPPSRGEVLVGKFLGRSAVVALGLTLGFAVSGVVTVAIYGGLPMTPFLGALAATIGLGITYVGIAIGISAVAATRARAMTVAITAYLVLAVLWDLVPNAVHVLVTGEMPGGVVPAWFLLVQGLSPTGAYNAVVQAILLGDQGAIAARIGGTVPSYLSPAVFLAILTAWLVAPLVIGYLRFRATDLG